MRRIPISTADRSTLRRLGVTDAQVHRLEQVLPLIRIEIQGYAANDRVRDEVSKVHKALVKAEVAINTMRKAHAARKANGYAVSARAEALGPLASGAASIAPRDAVAGIESATEGTVPEIVDMPTLLRLLVLAAERGLAEVPTQQYRKPTPTNAIAQIVAALNHPDDDDSCQAAARLQSALTGKAFVDLCSTVLCIANRGVPVSVDRAIRTFKGTYQFASEQRRWYFVGQQAP